MTRLFFCNTTYKTKPATDINPLILQCYPRGKILVLCARHAMVKRIKAVVEAADYPYPDQRVHVYGWWDAANRGLLYHDRIYPQYVFAHDAVVIICKDRIDERFGELFNTVCQLLTPNT